MSEIIELLKSVNMTAEQAANLQEQVQKDPLNAMQHIAALNLPPEFFTKLMQIVMTKPDALQTLMDGLGMTADMQKAVSEQFGKIPKN